MITYPLTNLNEQIHSEKSYISSIGLSWNPKVPYSDNRFAMVPYPEPY